MKPVRFWALVLLAALSRDCRGAAPPTFRLSLIPLPIQEAVPPKTGSESLLGQ